jgi:hypothetical protein
MKIKGNLKLKLVEPYMSPTIPGHKLPAGTDLELGWVSRKLNLPESGAKTEDIAAHHNIHKDHAIQIVDPTQPERDSARGDRVPVPTYWIWVPWEKVTKPTECTLSTTGYDLGCPMVALYCATRDDFAGIEGGRQDEIQNCPLCGEQIQDN